MIGIVPYNPRDGACRLKMLYRPYGRITDRSEKYKLPDTVCQAGIYGEVGAEASIGLSPWGVASVPA